MASKAIHPKRGCVVLGCHRTSRRFPNEWICGDHWRLVDREKKLLYRRLRRRYDQRWAALKAEHDSHPVDSKARYLVGRRLDALNAWWDRVDERQWGRMKAQAIERAAGI